MQYIQDPKLLKENVKRLHQAHGAVTEDPFLSEETAADRPDR